MHDIRNKKTKSFIRKSGNVFYQNACFLFLSLAVTALAEKNTHKKTKFIVHEKSDYDKMGVWAISVRAPEVLAVALI